ncbi:hypothetical protein, partial [Streptococcus pneumoniae]|uniref:hypothetical protein n=1 Tax=Streptococcus pneumoniae TaxID=1313 RepID=UPI001CB77D4E
IPTIAFYSRGVISNIEKALNSNDYSLQHVYKNEAISQLYQFTISQRMEHQADIIAYSDDDKPIPTIAFYSRGVISNIEKALNSNDYSLQHVYKN